MQGESGHNDFDRIFETMPADARASVRSRVLAVVASDTRLRRARALSRKAVCAYVAASLTATGVAYASSAALPGEPLYAVKIAVEEVAIAAAPFPTWKGSLQERAAVRRADEIRALAADQAATPAVKEAVGRFEKAAIRALSNPSTPKAKQAEEKLREHVDRVPEPAKARAKRALASAQKGVSSEKRNGQGVTKSGRKATAGKKTGSGNAGQANGKARGSKK